MHLLHVHVFQDYPKLSQAYYALLEVLTQDHMNFVCTLEPDVFIYILSSISEGLTGLGMQVLIRTVINHCIFVFVLHCIGSRV